MKKILLMLIKIFGAGIVSIIVLSILCFGYYFIPVHFENPNNNTDFVWTKNSIWVKATEGYSYGKFDSQGYNNKEVIDNPDIIILGSSHTIGTQVQQDQTFASVLAKKLEGKYTVYNMGMDNHTLYNNSANLKRNIELYDNSPKYIILETYNVYLLKEDVDNIVNDTFYKNKSYSNGLAGTLQKIPFFRLMYFQLTHGLSDKLLNKKVDESYKSSVVNNEFDGIIEEKEWYSRLFSYYRDIEKKYNTKLIIVYHPHLIMNEDGSVTCNVKKSDLEYFKYYANKYNISFINMADDFIDMYYNEYHLPHGFNTGLLGEGHLNKYGHEKVGMALYKKIIEVESSL